MNSAISILASNDFPSNNFSMARPWGFLDIAKTSICSTYIAFLGQSQREVLGVQHSFAPNSRLTQSDAKIGTSISVLHDVVVEEFIKKQMEEVTSSLRKWDLYLTDINAPVDVNAIAKTLDLVFEAMNKYGAGAVDLCNLHAPNINGEHLAAILRATSSIKNLIPGWANALNVAKTALTNQHIEIEDALFGLI
jgi:hypothetical protein